MTTSTQIGASHNFFSKASSTDLSNHTNFLSKSVQLTSALSGNHQKNQPKWSLQPVELAFSMSSTQHPGKPTDL